MENNSSLHDYKQKYPFLDIVYIMDGDEKVHYIAKQDVPRNTKITDTRYWQPVDITGNDPDYANIRNKPTINGVEVTGEMTSEDLGVYSKPSGGIPESDLAPEVQAQLNQHFKGWYDSSSNLPDNPVVGDYAYVKGATSEDPAIIYECTTAGTWSDSGRIVDTSSVQTFATGEEVNNVAIDDTHLVNPADGALPAAADVMQLKAKIEGVTASEVKGSTILDYNGCIVCKSVGSATEKTYIYSESVHTVFIPISQDTKKLRFLGRFVNSNNYSTGYVFINAENQQTIENNIIVSSGGDAKDISDYIVELHPWVNNGTTDNTEINDVVIPDGATYFCAVYGTGNITQSNFYCYLQSGTTVNDKVDKLNSKNFFDISNYVDGGISSDGRNSSATTLKRTDFIKVTPNTNYTVSWEGNATPGAARCACWYAQDTANSAVGSPINQDSVVVQKNGIRNFYTILSPNTAKFIRLSFNNTRINIQFEEGSSATTYEDRTPMAGYVGTLYKAREELYSKLNDKLDVKIGKNLFTNTNNTTERYINSNGGLSISSDYFVSDYIPVTPETSYYLSRYNDNYIETSSSYYTAWYDSDKELLQVGNQMYNTKVFTAPSNAAFFRFCAKNSRTQIMFNAGTSRGDYEKYSEIGGYYPQLKDGQVGFNKLNQAVKDMFNSSVVRLGSLMAKGTLAAAADTLYVSNSKQSVRKNILYSAMIEGTIDAGGVVIGVGASQDAYHGFKVTLTDTTLNIKRLDTSGSGTTVNHGLTLTDYTTLTIETELLSKEELNTSSGVDDGVSRLIVKVSTDLGDEYVKTALDLWGYGQLFITNLCASSIDYKLDFFPRDLDKNIWVFGDSYTEFDYRNRLPYFLWKNGYTNFLLNGHGGFSQSDSLTDLNSLLALGKKPSFIVWLLGQNGGSDTLSDEVYIVNSTQKTNLDNFVALCNNNNITPILATIPSVSGNVGSGGSNAARYHHGLSEYVRSLGYRYIDIEKAVGATPNGNWNEGLLGEDGVHPTIQGSYVIMRQILVDFPEIAIN